MKKQGFTLVELLAVIVILAVIAVITVPLIGDIIEKSKKGSLEDSAYGLVEAAGLYYTTGNIIEGAQEPITFDFEGGKQISEHKLEYKGKVEEGKVILNTNGKVVLCISDGKYYAYKNQEESKITSGIGSCSYNGETGDFDIISDVDTLNARIAALQEEINKGKTVLAEAITGKGITTSTTNSFEEMATNISQLSSEVGNMVLKQSVEGNVNLTGDNKVKEQTVTATYTTEKDCHYTCHAYISQGAPAYIANNYATMPGSQIIAKPDASWPEFMNIGTARAGETITCSYYVAINASWEKFYVDIYTDEK